MATNKRRSFFERLSGSVPAGEEYDQFDDDFTQPQQPTRRIAPMAQQAAPFAQTVSTTHQTFAQDDEPSEGQLPVDVYQTASEIVIRTFIAGVRPDELNVSISRDMVTVEGAREEHASVSESDYFHHELFWGSFSRTVLLPQEIDVDNASAGAKDGLLTIILPKLDKAKQTKLRIKAG